MLLYALLLLCNCAFFELALAQCSGVKLPFIHCFSAKPNPKEISPSALVHIPFHKGKQEMCTSNIRNYLI